MKKIIMLFSLIFLYEKSYSQLSFYVEEQNVINIDSVKPQILTFLDYTIPKTKFGVWSFTSVTTDKFAESFIGLNYKFKLDSVSFLEIGTGAGFETNKQNPIRGMSYVYFESDPFHAVKGKTQILFDFEYWGSDPWYLVSASHNISSNFGFRLHAQRNAMIGGGAQFYIIPQIMIYGVGGYNFEEKLPGAIVSVRGIF